MKKPKFKSVMSIDVEDAINVAYIRYFKKEIKPTKRVVENTERLLRLFSKRQIKSTFFVLGEVAESYPNLIKSISNDGHELGIHGFRHRYINEASLKKNKEEIKKAKSIVEDISGKQVYGYRAPYLSINEDSHWMIEVLAELGFLYDSSIINNFLPKHFIVDQNKLLTTVKLLENREFFEIPPTSFRLVGRNFKLLSGSYLRVLPFGLIKFLFNYSLKKQPVIIYIHPYEIDSKPAPQLLENEIKRSSMRTRFEVRISRYNRNRLTNRLDYFLDNYQFTTMIDLIKSTKIDNICIQN
jgi:polysaccharide deacetylase family protein (PEP-CTERM system associated)